MKRLIFLLGILVVILKTDLYAQDISLKVEAEEKSIASLDFGSLRLTNSDGTPLDNSSPRFIRLSITNRTRRRYKVSQRLSGPILNERNSEIEMYNLAFLAFGAKTGILPIQQLTPISQEEQIIFISDKSGEDESFQIQYHLMAPANTTAGLYRSNIIYRVSITD